MKIAGSGSESGSR